MSRTLSLCLLVPCLVGFGPATPEGSDENAERPFKLLAPLDRVNLEHAHDTPTLIVESYYSSPSGVHTQINGSNLQLWSVEELASGDDLDPDRLNQFLKRIDVTLNHGLPDLEFVITKVQRGERGTSVAFRQTLNGVFGDRTWTWLNTHGIVTSIRF